MKYGDAAVLRWQLNTDLTGVTSVRIIMSSVPGRTPLISRMATIEDAPEGIVSLTMDPLTDYGPGLLEAGMQVYVEAEVLPGPLTYPDCGWEILEVCYDLD